MPKSDLIRLRHMLDAAREAVQFASGRSRPDLNTDRMLVLSLVKSIEIIGEAASKVSSHVKSRNPGIPWQNITGMRNRLIHAYYDVNLDILWATVSKNLPPLIEELGQAIESEQRESS
jgi:uncharacterized protein with HEPN domain